MVLYAQARAQRRTDIRRIRTQQTGFYEKHLQPTVLLIDGAPQATAMPLVALNTTLYIAW